MKPPHTYPVPIAEPVDPIASALNRAYAATLAEPMPKAIADLLRALE